MKEIDQENRLSFDLPKDQSSVIKVIGVGGGGSNAVNYMYEQGIRGVDFVICNTDAQALNNSPVPLKVQLGVTLTEGLGAGANPEIGERAAMESIEELQQILEKNTKMIFVTAGMGGGTGTGAAPVVAKLAKEMGILVVGIVTIPFSFEGHTRMLQAEKGVEALRENVDSLIVINNNKLREVYGNLGFKAGFSRADEVLATASRGIAEVITHHYTQNIDLRDARTVLADSGTAIMGSGNAKGEQRAVEAITGALDSPLLNDNRICGADNVLLLIVSGNEEITIDEIGEINDFIQREAGGSANIIMGIGEDESLGDLISVTVIATGFSTEEQVQIVPKEPQKIIHDLEDPAPSPPSGAVPTPEPVGQQSSEEQKEDDLTFPSDVKKSEGENDQPVTLELCVKEDPVDEATVPKARLEDHLGLDGLIEETPDYLHSQPDQYPDGAIVHSLFDEAEVSAEDRAEIEEAADQPVPTATTEPEENIAPQASEADASEQSLADLQVRKAREREARLKAFNYRFKNVPNGLEDLEHEPAYRRKGVDLEPVPHSSEAPVSRYMLGESEEDGSVEIRPKNSFLHDNVD